LIVSNLIVFILAKSCGKENAVGKRLNEWLGQYKFNAYIRYYMMWYFDLTFFSVMKLVEGNDSTPSRKMATIASYVIFTISVVLPVFMMTIVCKRFEVLKLKAAKASFNTLMLKIDK
jgi:hypothetical protein